MVLILKGLALAPNKLERVAVFDIGSNAIRLVIADLHHDTKKYHIIEKVRLPLRMGKDVFEFGIFTEDTFKKSKNIFKYLLRMAGNHHLTVIKAYATASFRQAKNADHLLRYLKEKTGLEIEVISGEKEASLIYLAIKSAIDLSQGRALLMDIGGGSTEFILIERADMLKAVSIPIGALKLFQTKDLTAYEELFEQFRTSFAAFLPTDFFSQKMPCLFVGTGGNLRRMGKLKKTILGKSDFLSIEKTELLKIYEMIKKYDPKQLERRYRLKKDRAEVIHPAMDLALAVFNQIPLAHLELPNTGLANGILESMLH